jgi:DUF4097 and DUF4098 domain-containing protein YvlB
MRICLVLIPCLLVSNLLSQDLPKTSSPSPESPYVERDERQFDFFPGGKIEILTGVPGSIKVVGWQKGSIRVEAEKIIYYETPEKAKAFLKQSPIRIRHNQTSVTIRALAAPEPPALMEVNYTVYVPGERTDVNAKVEKGDFSIEGVSGWTEATIKEGSIDAKSMAGYFSATTLRGDILVEMSGDRWTGMEFDALTRQGSADLRLPAAYSAAVQLETRNGKITVDYPPQVVEGEETPPKIAINKNSQSLKASVGDGGAPIRIVTYSGDVKLSLKEQ